jgi:hypothetical protein
MLDKKHLHPAPSRDRHPGRSARGSIRLRPRHHARDTRAAPGDGRSVTPRADQAQAATTGSAPTGVAEPAEPSRGSAPADNAAPASEEPQ